jgi:dTDP-4-dehydrorhamnose 3,5-epimerase
MKIEPTKFPGLVTIQGFYAEDHRGDFRKLFTEGWVPAAESDPFREIFVSRSKPGVLRGMHFQSPPFDHLKLVSILHGRALNVCLDLRKESPLFGTAYSTVLEPGHVDSILIPKGVAHGFLALAEDTMMLYCVSTGHSSRYDDGVLWNSFGFAWGIETPILSDRDRSFEPLDSFRSPF